ncbi:hypothetical protein VOLCADRAFT_106142 [Volvox carteri f. nagariensis]|uniref:DJ-1/PfpI domain-containing protein n=1 Tax=Volvox carteri f. nagariensis TaxID=3068 RepID=D8U5B9_VOLCA|nr:uncharacterized protein VOLCADRAFT_106142 [Volvox carteri f. nagariensis]EFJ45186.1 hypothetical protein VOLCADRAFT_106142 [Volvox carteri f. nagariensis]|eukprot:XP_002953862.1 hypothetical protein VOLCADRAFT_106142 [Volvox carteri f. nagariensis]
MAKNILIVCTSCDRLGDTDEPTGCWAEEVVAPYYIWKKHGYNVTIASVKGGEVPMDEASLNPPFLTKEVEEFLLDDAAMKGLMESLPLSQVTAAGYDAVFLPGGHGTCWDFPDNAELLALLSQFVEANKVVSAVCHGPMGLVNVKGPDGQPLVAGKKATCFSDAEEFAVAKEKLVPFLLETRLKELGAVFQSAPEKWAPFALRDGNLVTGQNPASSARVAELVVEALSSA